MIAFEYLYQGVCGLARAHRAGTMAGHLGAAVAAGYFYGEDHAQLPDGVYRGVEGELKRIEDGEEAIWYNAKQAGITPSEMFQPFPTEPSDPSLIASIADALAKNVQKLRQSGHNVIFASIAIRALRDHPEYATPEIIAGIRKLTEGFNEVSAGRGYYGKQTGWLRGEQVALADDTKLPPYESIEQMVRTTLDELMASATIRRQGFGGLFHLINHAAGIVELDRLGFHELAVSALPAHLHHLRLWRSLPNSEAELGPIEKSTHDPREPEYWTGMLKRDQARLTHRIKTLYGYGVLCGVVDDADLLKQTDGAFLYLMA